MTMIEFPRYLPQPVPVWVKCEETRLFSPAETACLIRDADGEAQLIFVHPDFCLANEGLVSGIKVATSPNDSSKWLIDFPSTDRVIVSEEIVELVHGSPV